MARGKKRIDGQLSFNFSLNTGNYVVQANDLVRGKQSLKLNSAKLIRAAIMQIVPEDKELKPYIITNELPRSRAAGYLRGGSTTYNPISSTVLAPVRFDRVSYTLFLVLVLLHILISPLHFHAPLLWQHNIRLSKILLPIIFSSPVDTLQILLWLLYFSLFV